VHGIGLLRPEPVHKLVFWRGDCALGASAATGSWEEIMKRYGSVIGLKAEAIAEYKRLHAAVWPDVLKQIAASNIRNYSIYLKEPENLMFAYFEYHGTNYAADMAKMAADTATQEWWKVCSPIQVPLETRKEGEWWASMEEVFHVD
jgi:L-rhamnose mutarotase